ncbi:hypothetical protein SAY87_030402 [Trapa incisa]|uniref:RRM domain-containing protein n=1 Tax=Trapa incisa TaxID=236973 RepID=A0AAN7KU48_9MYRT|nr:hypothetical protein SAY87_030402 [Trapa incisa]
MDSFHPSQTSVPPSAHPYGYQAVDRLTSVSGNTDSSVTLLIRHFPEAIPQETLSTILSHYGASAVRPGKLKGCVFVDFVNEPLSYQAQRALNGLRFHGRVLKVERANNPIKANEIQHGQAQSAKEVQSRSGSSTNDDGKNLKMVSVVTEEPIAPKLGIDYPFPPQLEYAYPPPDGNIISNIANALIAVPRFYTQVLHLMNKMNIPAPFRMALPTIHVPPAAPEPPPPPAPLSISTKHSLEELSESESEMESSEEEVDEKASVVDTSRITVTSRKKRLKKEAIVGPAVNKEITHEEVGVKPAALLPKEIPLIKKNKPVLQIKIVPKKLIAEQKNDDEARGEDVPEKEKSNVESFATAEELERGKLPMEEILSLPQFKNYAAGSPAPVLYIKNLAKDVVHDDFYFIFGSLFGSMDKARSNLSVNLMQVGRMRGQAFITFPSVELAQAALNMANGFVFKAKPMIIQFRRSTPEARPNPTHAP